MSAARDQTSLPAQASLSRAAPLALAALIAGALAIGTSPILVRLSELSPTATAFWRVTLAVPLLVMLGRRSAIHGVADDRSAPGPATHTLYGPELGLAGLLLALDLICLHWSIRLTSVANAILFLNFAPLFVVGLSWVLHREPVTRRFAMSLALATCGTAFLVGRSNDLYPNALMGDLLGVLAGAFYGGYLFVVARCRRRLPTSTVMAASSSWCALVLLPTALTAEDSLLPVSINGWLVLLALAAITHVAGQGLVAYALRYLPAASSAATLMLQPVAAALGAWAIFGEALSSWQLAGAGIVVIGIGICQRPLP